MTKIILPELGEGIKKATVSYWYFKVGERVNEKDDLIELITDKATFNLPSPSSGVISEIIIPEGEIVDVGTVLGVIDEG
jgi:pyruvate/2-oxoglutarate dehydrogenase complex dihydrolipoamide acyltransferase (E2) component